MNISRQVYEAVVEHYADKEAVETVFKGAAYSAVCSLLLRAVTAYGFPMNICVFVISIILSTLAIFYIALHIGIPLLNSIESYIMHQQQKTVNFKRLQFICKMVYLCVCMAYVLAIYNYPFAKMLDAYRGG